MGKHGASLPHPRFSFIMLLLLAMMTGGSWSQSLHDPISRPCNGPSERPGAEIKLGGSSNTYIAGGVLITLVSMPDDLSGVFEFYLCPEEGNTEQEECLVRLPLQLADGSGTRFNLVDVPDKNMYEVPLILPDEVTCDKCTLQLRVVVDDCDELDNCKVSDKLFCSDIAIRRVKQENKRIFGLLANLLQNLGR